MPKKTKHEPVGSTPASEATPPAFAAKPAPSPKRATAKSTPRKAAVKQKAAPAARRKIANKKGGKSAGPVAPLDADIQLRAYFIAERRLQLGLQGDPANDWLEARKQLLEEVQKERPTVSAPSTSGESQSPGPIP